MILAFKLFHHLKAGQKTHLGKRKICQTTPYETNISAFRNNRGELIVVMHSQQIQEPIKIYAMRWEIETMFKAFKSNGFNMEKTHIKDPDRITTLFAVLSLAFCFALQQGIILVSNNNKLMRLKKHKAVAKSIFRIGIDYLQNILINSFYKIRDLNKVFRLIFKYSIQRKSVNEKFFVM